MFQYVPILKVDGPSPSPQHQFDSWPSSCGWCSELGPNDILKLLGTLGSQLFLQLTSLRGSWFLHISPILMPFFFQTHHQGFIWSPKMAPKISQAAVCAPAEFGLATPKFCGAYLVGSCCTIKLANWDAMEWLTRRQPDILSVICRRFMGPGPAKFQFRGCDFN